MKVCDEGYHVDNNGRDLYAFKDKSGIDAFVADFMTKKDDPSYVAFKRHRELKSKTAKGNLTEVQRNCLRSSVSDSRVETCDGYTLMFFEKRISKYDTYYNRVETGESYFYVFKVREETQEEIAQKQAKEEKLKSFEIDNLKMSYIVKLRIDSDTGLKLPIKDYYCVTFKSFDEAKAFLDKMKKVWHMQMTLNGLSNDIKHDFSNALTVYKGKCSRKYISRFSFSIFGKCRYEENSSNIIAIEAA